MEDEVKSTISEKEFNTLKDEIKNDAKSVMESILKENLPEQRLPMSETKAADDDTKFKTFGEFLTATKTGNDNRLKALNEGNGNDGGFLVPDEFRAELLRVPIEQSIIRQRARVIPMASDTVQLPRIDETSHASHIYGGVVSYWGAEASSATAAQPTFGAFELKAKKLVGYTQASEELMADSALGLQQLLVQLFGDAIRHQEEKAFIVGNGVGEPQGILNSDALVSVSKESGQAASSIVYENIIKMYSRMLPSSHGNAIWIAHPDTMPQLMSMALNVGTGGSAVYVTNASDGVPTTIFGRPVFFTEHCKSVGTVGDLLYVDTSHYVIGDRQSLTVASSEHVAFASGQTTWRFTERLDGAGWLNSAITPENGSNTISPFVALATRS